MSNNFEELYAAVEAARAPVEAVDALTALASAYIERDPAQTLVYAERARALSETCNYLFGHASALRLLSAGHFRLSDFEPSRVAVEQSLVLFTKLCNAKGEAECRTILGLLDWCAGNYSGAIDQHSRALDIFTSTSDRKNEATACNNMGITYHHLGSLDTALEYHLRSFAIREEIDDRRKMASSLGNIGSVYYQRGDTANALEYFFRTLALSEEMDDPWVMADSCSNIGSAYQMMDEPELALEYNRRCLSIAAVVGNKEGEAHALNGMGDNYASLKQYSAAQEYYIRSLEISTALGTREIQANTLLALGDMACACGVAAQAFEYSTRALALGEEIHSQKIIFEAHLIKSQCCKMAGDYEQAFYHLEQFQEAREVMYSEESDRKLNNLRVHFEVQQMKNEAEIYRLKNVELAAANEKLRVLNEEKNEFLGIAAHDLKNPLSTILMISNMMEMEASQLSEENVREFAGDIRFSSNRMFELITNLLDIHAIEHHGVRLYVEEMDIAGILRSTLASFHTAAEQKHIELRSDLSAVQAVCDRGAITQVLENLVSNALKFSPSGATVSVALHRCNAKGQQIARSISGDGSVARIEVRDQGPGLSEDDKKKLFKKFARLSAQPTAGEHSTGLGLSIAKKLVEAMSGKIWCESEEGNGAVFIVELPAC